MKVDVYRAKKIPGIHENLYVFVPAESNVEGIPRELKERTGGLVYEETIDIQPGEKRIALDTDDAIRNLSEKGYHEQGAKIEVKMRVSG